MVYVSGETSERRFRECRTMSGPGGRLIPLPRGGHLAAMTVQAMKNEPQRTLREMEGATMTSDDSVDSLRLDRDLPTTAEDVAVARRLRHGPVLGFDEYLQGLAAIDPASTAPLRSRPGPGGPPFDLIAQ